MKTKSFMLICICAIFTVNLSYARWPSVDPHAENYYPQSPYSFAGNNPVNNVDADGKDWIRSQQTNQYQWRDNVTESSQTPSGYTYVGASNSSILTDLGVGSSYDKGQPIYSVSLASESNALNQPDIQTRSGSLITTAISLAEGGAGQPAQGHLEIGANVSYGTATANNESGRKFEGVSVSATYSQPGGQPAGTLQVTNNGETQVSPLGPVTGPQIKSPESAVLVGNISIPAAQLAPGSLTNAYIGVGNTDPKVLIRTTVNLPFNLQNR